MRSSEGHARFPYPVRQHGGGFLDQPVEHLRDREHHEHQDRAATGNMNELAEQITDGQVRQIQAERNRPEMRQRTA